jgi:glycosyltransferase involved in cell wall biosynthesis
MNTPIVSVVMINYNGLPWLVPAMRSVLANENIPHELIVVDDLSKDGSRDTIQALAAADPRVVPVFAGKNLGISGARNIGISKARGTYISLIDSDDLFLPDTLERQVAAFERLTASAPRLSLLTSDAWLINERGQRKGRYISPDWWGRESTENPPLWTLPSTFFFRRDRVASFFEPYRSADAPIFVRRMEQLGPVGFIGEPLIEYRMRLSSVTNHRGAEMVREMKAAETSRLQGRLDNPLLPGDVPAPDWREVAAWVHGRNAKNAIVNGHKLRAAAETLRATVADPSRTFSKISRALRSRAN